MKNWILSLFAPALLFTSCLKSTPVDYLPFVVGEWTAVATNLTSATDSIKVLKFNTDRTINYAYGRPTTDGRMIWTESNELTYEVTDNRIAVRSTPNASSKISFTLNIAFIADGVMACTVSDYKLNGVSVAANNGVEVAFERSVINLRASLYGIWRTEAKNSDYQWFWGFKIGGRYDFFVYDPVTKTYVSKAIDKSTYKVYGRYLVCIFTDGFTGQPQGETAEVYLIGNLQPISLSLYRREADGQSISYTLVRQQKLP